MKAEKRKIIKDKLKKQIDELSDEELDKIAGGVESDTDFVCSICGEKFTDKIEYWCHLALVENRIDPAKPVFTNFKK